MKATLINFDELPKHFQTHYMRELVYKSQIYETDLGVELSKEDFSLIAITNTKMYWIKKEEEENGFINEE